MLGFHLPGEVIGLSAIHEDHYPCHAVALDTVALCCFSFPKMAMLATLVLGASILGFTALAPDEFRRVAEINRRYRERFGLDFEQFAAFYRVDPRHWQA